MSTRAQDPPPRSAASPDVLVIGGGIVGLACARELQRRGASVELWERGAPGSGASGKSAGMLAPLAEVPEEPAFFEICRRSRDLWTRWAPELEAETGIELQHDRSGALILGKSYDGAGADPATRLHRAAVELGEPQRWLDPAEAREWVPDLPADVGPILHLPAEHQGESSLVCRALAESLRSSGAAPRLGITALGVRPEGASAPAFRVWGRTESGRELVRRCGAVLVAAGAWSNRLDGLPPLPVRPVRGQMFRLDGVRWPFRGCLRSGDLYTVRRRGGRLLVGATVEEAGFDESTTAAGQEHLRALLRRHLPALADRPAAATWAGLRPGSPDGKPILGSIGESDAALWLAAGHYRNGILLAPFTAVFLADRILGQGSPRPEDRAAETLFSPGRFAPATP